MCYVCVSDLRIQSSFRIRFTQKCLDLLLEGNFGAYGCIDSSYIGKMIVDVGEFVEVIKVLNIGYWDRIRWGFFILDIGGDIRDTRAYRAFVSDTIVERKCRECRTNSPTSARYEMVLSI